MKRDWKVVKIKVNWIHRIFANFARMSETPEEGEVGHTVFNKATRSLIHASHYCKMVMRVSHPILPSNVSPGDVLNEPFHIVHGRLRREKFEAIGVLYDT